MYRQCIFDQSDLRGAKLSGADLSDSKLTSADLSDVNLIDTNLTRVDFKGTNLSGCDLTGVDLSEATLICADLRDAKLEGARLPPWDSGLMKGVQLEGATEWVPVDRDLRNAKLKGADLSGCNMEGVNLSNADPEGVNLCGANLSDADLSDTNLQGTPAPTCRAPAGAERQQWMCHKQNLSKWEPPWCLRSHRHAASASNLSPCAISVVMETVTITVPSAWKCTQRRRPWACRPLSLSLYQHRKKDSRLSRWRPAHPRLPGSCRLF